MKQKKSFGKIRTVVVAGAIASLGLMGACSSTNKSGTSADAKSCGGQKSCSAEKKADGSKSCGAAPKADGSKSCGGTKKADGTKSCGGSKSCG